MNRKKLIIRCAFCNALNVREETLADYESVIIQAATVMATQESMAILHRHGVEIQAAHVATLPDAGVQFKCVNGMARLTGKDRPGRPTALLVNGALSIEPDARQTLEDYVLIQVNGTAKYPEGLEGALGCLQVNGSTDAYPDGAVCLDDHFTVDRVFCLRAAAGLYYAAGSVVMTDARLDAAALGTRGVRILTPAAFVAEPLLDAAVALFDERARIVPVPEGCAFVDGDARLDATLVRRWGKNLFVNGDLTLLPENAGALGQVGRLHVCGDVLLPEALLDAFFALDPHFGNLRAYRGRLIQDRPTVSIRRADLQSGGLTVIDCAEVCVEDDVLPEEVEENLSILDCAEVTCPAQLQSAVERVSTDVTEIHQKGDRPDYGRQEDADAQCVSAAVYQF